MKQNPIWDRIQENMRLGVISQTGFLGRDLRKLIDIVEEDHRQVSAQGLTHEEIAQRMENISLMGKTGFGNPVKVDDIFQVTVEDSRGVMPCPFGHKGVYPKENTRVVNLRTGEGISWTALNIHMIREHGFYEGKGSPFRVEPEDIIRILELRK
ncbi:MAG: hypothetical protein ACOX6S_13415 [Clostridia bacterium]|jgi:hypothetical protein